MAYIGVDLHTNSFTVCRLSDDGSERFETFQLCAADLKRFCLSLDADDETAVEATGNSAYFHGEVVSCVGRGWIFPAVDHWNAAMCRLARMQNREPLRRPGVNQDGINETLRLDHRLRGTRTVSADGPWHPVSVGALHRSDQV